MTASAGRPTPPGSVRFRDALPLILASASPRRAQLLHEAGIDFEVHPGDVDEALRAGESPREHVCRLAEEKARAASRRFKDRAILAADTIVLVSGEILGKPRDAIDATRMLTCLSARTHQVLTGVCLIAPPGHCRSEVSATTVEFEPLTAGEIDWYVSTGEPLDKAGAYAIQGFASRFVSRIDGSYSNVVGLPVALVWRMCKEAGILVS